VQAGSGRAPCAWQPECLVTRAGGNVEAGGGLASAVINGGGLGVRAGADDDADRAGAGEGAAAVGVGGFASATDADAVAGVVAEAAGAVSGLAAAADADAAAGIGGVAAGGGVPPPQAAIKVRAARTTVARVRIRRRYQVSRAPTFETSRAARPSSSHSSDGPPRGALGAGARLTGQGVAPRSSWRSLEPYE
jgi:hypothetical protein